MTISSAICNSFKQEILVGTHNFTASSGNTFKIALYQSDASLGAGTTAYSTSEEITNTSGSAYSWRKSNYKCYSCFRWFNCSL